jgi:pyruvate,water dikinase
VLFFRYNELRVFMAEPEPVEGRALVAARRAERERQKQLRPPDWLGTVTPTQLAFPYLINWGFPDKFHRSQNGAATTAGRVEGIAGSPGVVEGVARVVLTEDEFDRVEAGDILVCQMTNPAWVVLFTKIAGLVTDAGGVSSHPAVLSREFGIPAVIGSSVATSVIKNGDRIRVDGNAGVVEVLEPAPVA